MDWGLVFEAGSWATGLLGLASRRERPQVAVGPLGLGDRPRIDRRNKPGAGCPQSTRLGNSPPERNHREDFFFKVKQND